MKELLLLLCMTGVAFAHEPTEIQTAVIETQVQFIKDPTQKDATGKPWLYIFKQKNDRQFEHFVKDIKEFNAAATLSSRYVLYDLDCRTYINLAKEHGISKGTPYFVDQFGNKQTGYTRGCMNEFLKKFTGKAGGSGDDAAPPPPPTEEAPPTPTPAPTPIPKEDPKLNQMQKQIDDLTKKLSELKPTPGPAGPPGKDGKGEKGDKGDNGKDGEVDYEKLAADCVNQLKPMIEQGCKGNKEQMELKFAEFEAALKAMADKMKEPPVHITYITSKNFPEAAQTDALVKELQKQGKPITIFMLRPVRIEDDNIRDVPLLHVWPEGKSVIGVDDVYRYLSSLKEK